MRSRLRTAVTGLLVVVATTGSAQQPPPGHDPLAGNFFPPELIMQHQQALGLNDEQRTYLIGEIQRAQGQATGVQWRLQGALEKLGALVGQERVDEGQVLSQLDSLLALEREMKRIQITLLVRLKNRLTSQQQAYLESTPQMVEQRLRRQLPPRED